MTDPHTVELFQIVSRHVFRDTDENYTNYFAQKWFDALSKARRVVLTDGAPGRIRLSFRGARSAVLLEIEAKTERLLPLATDWAEWMDVTRPGHFIDDERRDDETRRRG
jgi:hypothetical protein